MIYDLNDYKHTKMRLTTANLALDEARERLELLAPGMGEEWSGK